VSETLVILLIFLLVVVDFALTIGEFDLLAFSMQLETGLNKSNVKKDGGKRKYKK
jgi:hypothetical protein